MSRAVALQRVVEGPCMRQRRLVYGEWCWCKLALAIAAVLRCRFTVLSVLSELPETLSVVQPTPSCSILLCTSGLKYSIEARYVVEDVRIYLEGL